MVYRYAEHVHIVLEYGSLILILAAWVMLRRRRSNKERVSLEYSKAHEHELQQKDLHIREVHHRVANQMGLTAALLHFQASRSPHPEAKASLFDSENRVRTLAKLHTRLDQMDPHCQTLLYPYLSDLAHDLITSLRPDLIFRPEFAHDSPAAKPATALTCGLLVHELITNCIKHAFPLNQGGTIRLSLNCPPPDRFRISIHDNGAGLPAGFTPKHSTSSGMAIISALTKDLAGTFSVMPLHQGTEFIVEFPLSEIKKLNESPQ